MLDYKAPLVVVVNPAITSQSCAECGVADAASRQGRMSECVACSHADLSAARTIRRRGQALLHGQVAASSGPANRETDRWAA